MKKLNLKKVQISKLTNGEMYNIRGATNVNCTDYCPTECKDVNCNTEHYACDPDVGGGPIGGQDTGN